MKKPFGMFARPVMFILALCSLSIPLASAAQEGKTQADIVWLYGDCIISPDSAPHCLYQ